MKRNQSLKSPGFGLLLALLFTGSMWFYVQKVLAPHQRTEAAIHGGLEAIFPTSIRAGWERANCCYHRDPYSAEITREIQIGYYGRPLDPARARIPRTSNASLIRCTWYF